MTIIGRRITAYAVVILLFFVLSCPDVSGVDGRSIVLDGAHKFSAGDNPDWASPAYDDSKWKTVKIPGSWQSQGIASEDGIGWYRIHFSAKGISDIEDAGVLFGRIGDADEAFLNGVKLGGELRRSLPL